MLFLSVYINVIEIAAGT